MVLAFFMVFKNKLKSFITSTCFRNIAELNFLSYSDFVPNGVICPYWGNPPYLKNVIFDNFSKYRVLRADVPHAQVHARKFVVRQWIEK